MKLFDFSNMKKSHLEKNSVYIQSNRLSFFFFFLTKPKHFSPMYNFCQVNSLLQNIQILMEPFVGNVSTSAVAYQIVWGILHRIRQLTSIGISKESGTLVLQRNCPHLQTQARRLKVFKQSWNHKGSSALMEVLFLPSLCRSMMK